jgi:putative oxidoreductase
VEAIHGGAGLLLHFTQQTIELIDLYPVGIKAHASFRRAGEGAQPTRGANMTHSRNAAVAATLLRVTLGALFIAHALLKYFVFTLPGTAGFFESLGLPGALGYATFAAELAGGVLLVLGVQTRIVALALVPIMLGATWAHLGNGWVFSGPKGGWEYPAFWTVTLVVQALLGDGAWALRPAPTTRAVPARAGLRSA